MKKCCKKFIKDNKKVLKFLCNSEKDIGCYFYPEDYRFCGYCGQLLMEK